MTTTPLSPLGAVRRRFAGDASDDFFRRLGVGAARCDLGDQGLYLAEELVSWNPWMNDDDRRAFAVFVLALLLANRHQIGVVKNDVGHLQHWVVEQRGRN